jgi:Carboxypeptidase regulatory-like domain
VGAPSWLNLAPSAGVLTADNPTATISVAPAVAGLSASQTAQVAISVTDSANGQVQGSPQPIGISLALQQPCTVQISPGSIALTSVQGQSSITLQANNTCTSINWNAMTDDGGKGWLSIDTANSGNGSIIVKADSSNLSVGTYTGSVSVKVTDGSGNPVQGGTQTIQVTLQVLVSTFTVSGTVMACADSACSSSQPLGAATVTLTDSSGQRVANVAADSFGNFSFSNVAPGSYTITVSGTDNSNVSYSGNQTIAVSGKQQVMVQSFATSPASSVTPTPSS